MMDQAHENNDIVKAARRLQALIDKYDYGPYTMHKMTGIDLTVFTKWSKGDFSDKTEFGTLARVADALGYSMYVAISPRV